MNINKGCFSDYIGQELRLGDRKKANCFGVSANSKFKNIYFLTGRAGSEDKKDFFKFYEKALLLKKFADYVYVFEIEHNNFEESNKFDIDLCKKEGIGILLINNNGIKEFLSPKRIKLII